MDTEKKIQFTLPQIHELAVKILAYCQEKSNIVCFHGPMGAGKTTLIKAMVQALGGQDQGHSPTFGLVNEYHLKDGRVLGYHFDFYRLENEWEALDVGFEEYLESGHWIFIEWPEKVASLIPEDVVHLGLKIADVETRTLELS